jgi:CRP-like cAMP-binding protein
VKKQAKVIFRNPFLKDFSTVERVQFLNLCHRRSYQKGETVYAQHDPGTGLYFIENGLIELNVAEQPDESQEHSSSSITLTDSDHFGLFAIEYDYRRKSTATCLSNCELYGFFQADYEVLKKRHPKLACRFIEAVNDALFRRLDQVSAKLQEHTDAATAYRTQLVQPELLKTS